LLMLNSCFLIELVISTKELITFWIQEKFYGY